MPVIESIKPQNRKDLERKIKATKPGEESTILEDVQTHLEKWGSASYRQTEEGTRDVDLTASKCIIFLITGEFKVGEVEITTAGEGHVVENETKIQLQPYTAVAIINQG